MKKQLKKAVSVFLAAVLCCSVFTVTIQAAPVKGYVKSVTMKSKATIVIPADKKFTKKSYEVTVKVKGTVSKKITATSSNKTVATVKVKGNKLLVTAKKAGKANIIVTTNGKNKKGKQVKKTLALTVKKAAKPVVSDPKQQEKAKEATDMKNIRAAVTEVLAAYNTDSQPHSKSVPATQEQAGWQDADCGKVTVQLNGEEVTCNFAARTKADGAYVVTVSKGTDGVDLVIDGGSAAQTLEEQEKEATDMKNIRAAYEEVMAAYNKDGQPHSKSVPATQERVAWQDVNCGRIIVQIDGEDMTYMFPARTKADGPYVVTVSKGTDGVVLVIDGGSAAQTLEEEEKEKEATDMTNIQSALTEVIAEYNKDTQPHSKSVDATQEQVGWQDADCGTVKVQINGEEVTYNFAARTKADGPYVVTVSKGTDGMVLVIDGGSAAQTLKEEEKAKEATEMENILAAYEEVLAACNKDSQPHSKSVDAIQEQALWQNVNCGKIPMQINGEEMTYMFPARTKADGPYVVFVWKDKDGVHLVIGGSSDVEKTKEHIDTANVRAAYEEVLASYNEDTQPHSKIVPAIQEQAFWQNVNCGRITTKINGEEKIYEFAARTKADGPYVVTVSKGTDGMVLVIDGGSAAQALEEQEKSKEQTDTANVQAAVEEVLAAYNTDSQSHSKSVDAAQEQANWQDENCGKVTVQINGEEKTYMFAARTKADGPYVVTVSKGTDGVNLVIDGGAAAQTLEEQEKAKEATDMTNIRAALTEVMTAYNKDSQPHSKSVAATQEQANWQDANCGQIKLSIGGEEVTYNFAARTKADGPYVVFVWKDKDGMHLEIGGSSEVERTKEQIDTANVRAAYEEVMAAYNEDGQPHSKTVPAIQEQAAWQSENCGKITTGIVNGEEMTYMFAAHTKDDGPYTVSVLLGKDGAYLVIE